MKAAVKARANIALIKYWGKAESELNIPAVGSISITLKELWSETRVEFDNALPGDTLLLDGESRPDQLERVTKCLDVLRARAGCDDSARVVSSNNFPTGAGLASSASGFAALAASAASALGLELPPRELSVIARQGSGSAARSIFGGFAEMHAGSAADGNDSFAEPLLAAEAWPLEVVIAITERGEKAVGSRAGMGQSAATSPFYGAWVQSSDADLDAGRQAILDRNFGALAEVSEHSCLKMHATAMAARPPLIYWNAATVACLHAIRELRESGLAVFFTIDAGPQAESSLRIRGPGAGSRCPGGDSWRRGHSGVGSGPGRRGGLSCAHGMPGRRASWWCWVSTPSWPERPALVLAVDRYCRAEIGPSEDARCHILTKTFESHEVSYSREAGSGLALIDSVVAGAPAEGVVAWRGAVDSRAFFAGDRKLGLGSSAAALTAWAAAWAAYARHTVLAAEPTTLQALIELHRAFQGGAGSWLDIAASLFMGASYATRSVRGPSPG